MKINLLMPILLIIVHFGLSLDENSSVSQLLFKLGEPVPKHFTNESSENLIRQGHDLIFKGQTLKKDGNLSSLQSKWFKCTSCHNTEREDPDLKVSSPQARLDYAVSNGLPFYQSPGFYGIVNKAGWYLDDYVKKYGDLVKPANTNLIEAIQLCARECSQGRAYDSQEMKAVLAYLWTLEYKIGDLDFSADELKKLKNAAGPDEELLSMVKSKFLAGEPSHFGEPPADYEAGYGLKGNPENGRHIFELSCQKCHLDGEESRWGFPYKKHTFKWLAKQTPRESHFSIYQAIRYGTHPKKRRKAYMPLYPVERLSDQMIEDLRAFIFKEKEKY